MIITEYNDASDLIGATSDLDVFLCSIRSLFRVQPGNDMNELIRIRDDHDEERSFGERRKFCKHPADEVGLNLLLGIRQLQARAPESWVLSPLFGSLDALASSAGRLKRSNNGYTNKL